jgi:DNA-binding beta-propeller fold protein YncE
VWEADELNQRVRKYSGTGTLLTTVTGYFMYPLDLAVDSSGDVWVADSEHYRLEEFNSSGSLIRYVGSQGTANGQFEGPCGMDVDPSGNVWVADLASGTGNRLEEFSSTGTYLNTISSGFNYPRDVAVDSRDDIWVADAGNNSIEELSGEGTPLMQITTAGNVRFGHIIGLAIDPSGDLWATDIGNDRIVEFNINPTPEPPTLVLASFAAVGLLGFFWRGQIKCARQQGAGGRHLDVVP